jgi:hypothetical protein
LRQNNPALNFVIPADPFVQTYKLINPYTLNTIHFHK